MNYILNEKLKNKNTYLHKDKYDTTLLIDDTQKVHYPPSVNEWHNSIYTYNKRALVSLLTKDSIVYTLLDNYFNLKPSKWMKIKIKRKWESLKRIFISKPEIKHSSNKVIITVYTLNKEKLYFLKKLKNLNKMFTRKVKYRKFTLSFRKFKFELKKRLKKWNFVNKYLENGIIFPFIIRIKKPQIINFFFNIINNTKSLLYKDIYTLKEKKNLFILNVLKKFLDYKLKKIYIYKTYTSLLYLNNLKFNINLMLGLKNILYKIYNKKIELNIVNLKYLYLENSILANAVVRKLNNRKKRILKVIRKALRLAKMPKLDPLLKIRKTKKIIYIKKDNILTNKYNDLFKKSKNNVLKTVFKRLNNKHVIGVRLEGKGRLTRRLTASRSIFKSYYKGGLKNIFSSFQGLSAVMLKGFVNSNVQYTNINSKNRNGSFGLKSWIGSF
jgi:hypothetical protein